MLWLGFALGICGGKLIAMSQTNTKLSRIFQQMADVLEVLGANRFKVIAFQKAARVLGELTEDVAGMDSKSLRAVEGIGKGMADRIEAFVADGELAEAGELLAKVPRGVVKMLDVPGLGPKTVSLLWREAGLNDLDELAKALDTGELEVLPGFGKKKIENIRKNLAFAKQAGKRARIGEAMPLALWLVDQLKVLKQVKRIEYAGSLRRGKETIGDLDLLVAADTEDAEGIMDAFVGLEVVTDVIAKGKTKSSVRTGESSGAAGSSKGGGIPGGGGGMQVDLRVVPMESYGAALMYFTGSKEHNVRLRERAISMGMKLNEWGLTKQDSDEVVASKTEEDVFKALGLAWVPPELREDRGEVALAEKDELPALIEVSDIRAELHTHTTASDGMWTIEQLATAVADRGFHTVAITDHSKGQVQANGLSDERLEKHIVAVRGVAEKLKGRIAVLAGSEVDILADGRLDYPDSLLKELDVVVASPHAALTQESAKCTARFLKAMQNPYVTIMGHPTGRLVGRREGLSPDMGALFKAAAERGIAMEINANHWRLDLRDTHARAAIAAGVKLAINTDAHGLADLDQLQYGVLTARRAGVTKNNVVNCMTKAGLAKWLKSVRV
jgi:DNA polymerase (family X)